MSDIQKDRTNKYLLTADIYRLLSLGLSYPDSKTVEKVKRISAELLNQPGIHSDLLDGIKKLIPEIDEDIMRSEYSRVFISGGVPITESNLTLSFSSVSDVSAFYAAFGFSPKSGETPDSIMYELEFLALLALKIAIAPNKEAMEVTEDAYNKFLEDHVTKLAERFAEKINHGDANAYYKILTGLLLMHVKSESDISV